MTKYSGAMQHKINSLTGYVIKASDGDLGKLHEFYFDDETWTIRYMVVETGNWLLDRKVLVSLVALGKPDETSRTVSVNLTCDQVRNSPDIDTERPVYRQHEVELHEHYQWPIYWESGFESAMGATPLPFLLTGEQEKPEPTVRDHKDNPHLRSTRKITGYHIHAIDGEIGHVEDFIVDDENWSIRFLVVDTTHWLPGRKVLISPRWIQRVKWDDSSVHLDLSREAVRQSPEFDPSKPISRNYKDDLHTHYGRTLGITDFR
ncbi:MAG: PRC-barrel domain-containing protein [Fibrobacterota bacterium]